MDLLQLYIEETKLTLQFSSDHPIDFDVWFGHLKNTKNGTDEGSSPR